MIHTSNVLGIKKVPLKFPPSRNSSRIILSIPTFSGALCIYLSRSAGGGELRLEEQWRRKSAGLGKEEGKQGREKWRKRSRAWYAMPSE